VGGLGTPVLAGIAGAGVIIVVVVIVLIVRLTTRRRENSEADVEDEQVDLLEPSGLYPGDGEGYFVTEASPLFTEVNGETGE
jgi:hypothetical protein